MSEATTDPPPPLKITSLGKLQLRLMKAIERELTEYEPKLTTKQVERIGWIAAESATTEIRKNEQSTTNNEL